MYFLASRSMWASAPSSTASTVPRTTTTLYGSSGSTTETATAGLAARLASLARPLAVLNARSLALEVDPHGGQLRATLGVDGGDIGEHGTGDERLGLLGELRWSRVPPGSVDDGHDRTRGRT